MIIPVDTIWFHVISQNTEAMVVDTHAAVSGVVDDVGDTEYDHDIYDWDDGDYDCNDGDDGDGVYAHILSHSHHLSI